MLFRNTKLLIVILVLLVLGGVVWANSYFQLWSSETIVPGEIVVVDENEFARQNSSPKPERVEYEIQVVAENLFVPWSIVFTSDTRMLVTERNGAVRVIENGQLQPEPVHRVADVSTQSEEGLMGMAVDPSYESNSYLYLCYAYPAEGTLYDRVVRYSDGGDKLVDETIILDRIPAAKYHAGCRLRFGPDNKLYITTGDATNGEIAQDINSLGGKILRINADGSIPDDNPFGNEVWSYGHRNPQGIDWHSSGVMYSTEHGPSGFDGPGGGDEVNIIERGQNYGWPLVSHEESIPEANDPELVFTPAFAPASGMFYTSDVLPQFTDNFFFGGLRGEGIMRVMVSEDGRTIVAYEKLPEITFGRIREIAEGPDGYIYFTTSNRDNRGNVYDGDDKLYRIAPQETQ